LKIKEEKNRGEKGVDFESKEHELLTTLRIIIRSSSFLGNYTRIFQETDGKRRKFNNIFARYVSAARSP
jgi:hypothetical protein